VGKKPRHEEEEGDAVVDFFEESDVVVDCPEQYSEHDAVVDRSSALAPPGLAASGGSSGASFSDETRAFFTPEVGFTAEVGEPIDGKLPARKLPGRLSFFGVVGVGLFRDNMSRRGGDTLSRRDSRRRGGDIAEPGEKGETGFSELLETSDFLGCGELRETSDFLGCGELRETSDFLGCGELRETSDFLGCGKHNPRDSAEFIDAFVAVDALVLGDMVDKFVTLDIADLLLVRDFTL